MATRIRARGFQVGMAITLLILLGIIILPKVFGGNGNRFSVGLLGSASRLQPALERTAAAAGVTLDISRPADRPAADQQGRGGHLGAGLCDDPEARGNEGLGDKP